jgi:hypothetical protein
MVLACKSDLAKQVDPKLALELLRRYDSGLVEATKESGVGKDRMRRSFEWLIKAILRDRSERAIIRVSACSDHEMQAAMIRILTIGTRHLPMLLHLYLHGRTHRRLDHPPIPLWWQLPPRALL